MRLLKVLMVILLATFCFNLPSDAGLIKKVKNKVTNQDEKDKKKEKKKKEAAEQEAAKQEAA
ncbi:MAG TPA: hypothetical protein PKH29_12145, partial [Oscillospiraceae bacterium]|nr:hypothetical protein [Oscillospiraceae bacterium]